MNECENPANAAPAPYITAGSTDPRSQTLAAAPGANGAQNSDRFANALSRSRATLRKDAGIHLRRGSQPYRLWALCIISFRGPSKRLKAFRSNDNNWTFSLTA